MTRIWMFNNSSRRSLRHLSNQFQPVVGITKQLAKLLSGEQILGKKYNEFNKDLKQLGAEKTYAELQEDPKMKSLIDDNPEEGKIVKISMDDKAVVDVTDDMVVNQPPHIESLKPQSSASSLPLPHWYQ
ncbi:uncharacterized protein BJ212DRAFT_1302670 [Suillus subaureus]|uniref:Uncharacterized protein n=1 Tax=Suillus subaureus TaxID=48587 RepID=A0A9P7E1S6_9AGAM|nr:uncharacterized protein BJ212DRAFT_1302670 [Suillus subaureus]KAG1809098.1 hypothetical protein BJ212DRAFT_1302670 [Suillus subaureus]